MQEASDVRSRHGWWWKALLIGMALWALTALITAETRNPHLIPALILVGSFLIPLCTVLFAAERLTGHLSTTGLLAVFFLSGLFGVLGASVVEAPLTASVLTLPLIGLIEESLKLGIVVVAGWRYVPKTATQGALLGAVVGAGFAAFESAGYAFNASLSSGGISLAALVQTEILRAAVSPAGHVLWTAIVGAVLFRAARQNGFRLTVGLAVTLLAVSALHAAWDAAGGLATLLALLLTGELPIVERFGLVAIQSSAQVGALALVFYVIALALITAAGGAVLAAVLRRPRRRRPVGDAGAAVT